MSGQKESKIDFFSVWVCVCVCVWGGGGGGGGTNSIYFHFERGGKNRGASLQTLLKW